MAILDREFLEMRAKILELAASFDRIERAGGDVAEDRRFQLLLEGMRQVLDDDPNRAEALQLLFSREYTPEWRERFAEIVAPTPVRRQA